MTHIMHRLLNTPYPVAVAGDGPYLIDAQGKRYIDSASGAGVSCLGHSAHKISEAIARQSKKLAYVYNAYFTTEALETFADNLVAMTPPGLDWVFPGSGGSESMDGALKLALQYHNERGEPQRRRFISRRQSYHGCAIGGLAISGNQIRRMLFEQFLPESHFVSPCYEYRDRSVDETPEAYGARLAQELNAQIEELGPDTVAAFVAETVVGATAGCVPPVPGYFKAIAEVCRKHGVLLILDEILSGCGRTGTYLSCEQDGVVPDIAVVAKGLGAGYQPISAILVSNGVVDTIARGRGFFFHGHTYNGHATAAAAATAVIDTVRSENLLENVQAMGARLREALRDRLGQHPHVGDIRGRGLLIGVELVADRETKAPFPAETMLWNTLQKTAFARGLICYPGFGTADGVNGDHVLLAPPFIINETHVAEIVDKLAPSIDEAIAAVRTAA
jgi:adenosylmethionine-8-amino-7-oxononanoate aminotransferase